MHPLGPKLVGKGYPATMLVISKLTLRYWERSHCLQDPTWCEYCKRRVVEGDWESHLGSSTHRWRSRFRYRDYVLQRFRYFQQGDGNLAEYLSPTHHPMMDLVTHVSFRLLSGTVFAEWDVVVTGVGLMACQMDMADLLQVHPNIFRIQFSGAPPRFIGHDAYLARMQHAMILRPDGCSLCFCSHEVMAFCQFCKAYVCGVCQKCPNWDHEKRCWGCMEQSTDLTPTEAARNLVLRRSPVAQQE